MVSAYIYGVLFYAVYLISHLTVLKVKVHVLLQHSTYCQSLSDYHHSQKNQIHRCTFISISITITSIILVPIPPGVPGVVGVPGVPGELGGIVALGDRGT